MLIYKNERCVPTDVNMLVIRAREGQDGYFFIHRALYDQCVILKDLYENDLMGMIKEITGEEKSRADVDLFFETAPDPINYFAPFLLLVKSELTDFVDMVGAIHVMSGPVNLRRMLTVPREMRAGMSFSLSIKEEYKLAWDRFDLTVLPYSDNILDSTPRPMSGTATVTKEESSDSNKDEDKKSDELTDSGGGDEDDPLMKLLMGDMGVDDEDEDDDEDIVLAPMSMPGSKPASAGPALAPMTMPGQSAPAPAASVSGAQPGEASGLDLLFGGGL